MKKIILKFAGLGYQDYFQACVELYDSNNCLVGKGKTYNGKISFCVRRGCFYKVVAKTCSETICRYFYVNDCNSYFFVFSRALIYDNRRVITFLLTDSNYFNLPIEKGEIIFG